MAPFPSRCPTAVTVTAQDAFGNTTPAYSGTVHLTSSDPPVSLPSDYLFTAADAGTHIFNVTLKTHAVDDLFAGWWEE